jgi:hypothetical protein
MMNWLVTIKADKSLAPELVQAAQIIASRFVCANPTYVALGPTGLATAMKRTPQEAFRILLRLSDAGYLTVLSGNSGQPGALNFKLRSPIPLAN